VPPPAELYKLVYFNIKGRAEPIRLIFVHAGVEFEDFGIDRSAWPSGKASKAGYKILIYGSH